MQNAGELDSKHLESNQDSFSRVLVVDDVPTNRSVLKSLLIRPNCEVVEAEDGTGALQIIGNTTLDLVVLDVVMPGMSGINVLSEIRKKFTSSELPVLMLTVKRRYRGCSQGVGTGSERLRYSPNRLLCTGCSNQHPGRV